MCVSVQGDVRAGGLQQPAAQRPAGLHPPQLPRLLQPRLVRPGLAGAAVCVEQQPGGLPPLGGPAEPEPVPGPLQHPLL